MTGTGGRWRCSAVQKPISEIGHLHPSRVSMSLVLMSLVLVELVLVELVLLKR